MATKRQPTGNFTNKMHIRDQGDRAMCGKQILGRGSLVDAVMDPSGEAWMYPPRVKPWKVCGTCSRVLELQEPGGAEAEA